jgi:hypothetical protein
MVKIANLNILEYHTKPFQTDEEKLEYLFKMYEGMTSK